MAGYLDKENVMNTKLASSEVTVPFLLPLRTFAASRFE